MKTIVALTCGVIALWPWWGYAREWTDDTGKYKVEAECVGFEESPTPTVRLKKHDGKIITVQLNRLSRADQEFVKARYAKSDSTTAGDSSKEARIVTGFECSPKKLQVKRNGESDFEVRFPRGNRYVVGWFVFKIEDAAGKTLRIDLKDVPRNKWMTLNPVYCYTEDLADMKNYAPEELQPSGGSEPASDLVRPEAKKPAEDAVADSSDGSKQPSKKLQKATNGPLIPDTSGQKWHYITDVKAERSSLILRQKFEEKTVFVAMRPPYTPGYHENFVRWVEEQDDVRVHTVGRSPEGHPLHVIEIGQRQDATGRDNPCIVMYAREHADEHDTSWPAEGLVRYLLSEESEAVALRSKAVFLIIPLLDPDGAARSEYENLTNCFKSALNTPESDAYGKWFRDWVNEGGRLDLTFNLHNVESKESPHVLCAMMETRRVEDCKRLHAAVMRRLAAHDIEVRKNPWFSAYMHRRLGGFLKSYYGTMHMLYEVNSQAPKRHLTLRELRLIGPEMARAAVKYLHSKEGGEMMAVIDRFREERDALLYRYAVLRAGNIERRNPFDAETLLRDLPAMERFHKAHSPGGPPGWLKPVYDSGRASVENIPKFIPTF